MVGISLSLVLFDPECDGVWGKIKEQVGSTEAILRNLWREGARSVELRIVRSNHAPERIANAVKTLLDFGFSVSIHSEMKSALTAVSDVFNPLKTVLADKLLDSVVLTVHALQTPEETVTALFSLSDRAMKEDCKISIALENGRKYGDKSEGECSEYILNIVKRVNRANVGICWDFGHMWYNVRKFMNSDRNYLPSPEFIERVIHTHIHTARDGDLKTHFPPNEDSMPLTEWMKTLSFNYIYNTEPEPERWLDDPDPAESLFSCVRNVAAAVPLKSASIENLKKN